MTVESINRRDFVCASGTLAGSSLIRLGTPAIMAAAGAACSARDAGEAFTTLGAAEARELDALSARILPTTDTPGAREAGVLYFMDKVLGGPLQWAHGMLGGALQEFQADVAAAYPGAERFSDLDEAEQDSYLETHDRNAFFELTRALTIMGFFAMSSYGGNRDNVGWKLIGFEGHGAWSPPFGYYDAEFVRSEQNGD
ncbi:MAG: gluconate 2-dehydrogenase subunit 3 family protein [Gammaproteobacteria bacterium]|nr:gluconate 2-dehydrogenase subunit 3 family protein [Gammaproteobacteria bacterium]MDH4255991.1 gluconate 2-dehydrogenase subunit 3 family protein [Gammaproteobacteria bacterium]MDH5309244.1 gluconate 2-dehydrogenase subunit 3 family protein [Gammaproteobacteria bacterium]